MKTKAQEVFDVKRIKGTREACDVQHIHTAAHSTGGQVEYVGCDMKYRFADGSVLWIEITDDGDVIFIATEEK